LSYYPSWQWGNKRFSAKRIVDRLEPAGLIALKVWTRHLQIAEEEIERLPARRR
jgi:hypothetical protein